MSSENGREIYHPDTENEKDATYNFTEKAGPLFSPSSPREEAAALCGFCHRGSSKLE